MTDHLQALLQKKLRLDIEIRRTKNQLTKLKQRSSTLVKFSASVEQEVPSDPISSFLRHLEEDTVETELLEFQKEETRADRILQTAEALEGYLITEDDLDL